MIMLLFVRHRKDDLYIRIEPMQLILFEVGRGFEVDAIDACLEGLLMSDQAPFSMKARVTGTAAAGRPSAVSRMCVEMPMVTLTPASGEDEAV